MTRLRAGMKLRSNATGATKLKLVTSYATGSRVYWWCEIEDAYMGTYEEGRLLAEFREATSFFEIGKAYKFSFSERTATYTILAVYTNKNPRSSKLKALARVVEADGKDDIITLSQYDFDRMIEAG